MKPFRFHTNLIDLSQSIKEKDNNKLDELVNILNKDINEYRERKNNLFHCDKIYFTQQMNYFRINNAVVYVVLFFQGMNYVDLIWKGIYVLFHNKKYVQKQRLFLLINCLGCERVDKRIL